jgi:hypothetical protein
MSKYRYLMKDRLTCEDLEQLLGVRVLSITTGNIIVGEPQEALDDYGESTTTISTVEGIEIEFEDEPAIEQLNKLDLLMTGYRRQGGKSLDERLEEIEEKIKTLEEKG